MSSFMRRMRLVFLGLCLLSCGLAEAQSGGPPVSNYLQGASEVLGTPNYQSPNRSEPSDELSLLRSQIQQHEQELAELRSHSTFAVVPKRKELQLQLWFVNYESVIVQPLQSNDTAMIVETANGFSHVPFPWQMNYSPRVQFGVEGLGDNLGWRVRLWKFDASRSFDANAVNGLIPTGREATAAYLSEDGDITTGLTFIEAGTFISRVRADVIDWEVHRKLSNPVDFYAGIRYAKLAQSYRAATDQGTVDAASQFRGLGPTVAFGIAHLFPDPRFSLFANLRGSLLFGQKDYGVSDSVNNLEQTAGSITTRKFKDGADTLSSNAELQLGARFSPARWFAASVALEAQHYTNVGGPNPSAVFLGPDSGIAGGNPYADSLSFIGMNVGTQLMW
jgi:hypothetical protein